MGSDTWQRKRPIRDDRTLYCLRLALSHFAYSVCRTGLSVLLDGRALQHHRDPPDLSLYPCLTFLQYPTICFASESSPPAAIYIVRGLHTLVASEKCWSGSAQTRGIFTRKRNVKVVVLTVIFAVPSRVYQASTVCIGLKADVRACIMVLLFCGLLCLP